MVDREAFEEPWRVRCPFGHASVRPHAECDTAYCEKCNRTFGFGEMTDTKERGRAEA